VAARRILSRENAVSTAAKKPVLSHSLTGPQKAALVIVTMGREAAAEVFRNMRQEDIEALTSQVARLGDIESEMRDAILGEFDEMMMANSYLTEGGLEVARDILFQALGQDRAMEVLERIQQSEASAGAFQKLTNVDGQQLVNLIQGEHPQTISLILGQLKAKQAASVLVALPAEVQPDVISRMATMGQSSPEMVAEIEGVLKQHISTMTRTTSTQGGGVNVVAEILNLVDRSTEKNILGVMERENPDLAIQIKNLMFVFEDILHLGDREIQRVLKDVDSRDLAVALKLASEDVKNKIFSNLSQRAAEMLKDELDFLGPVRLKNVEDAQRRVVEIVRKLDEGGEIHISRGGAGEELIV
jgi:flagellar motor switch protein FliG